MTNRIKMTSATAKFFNFNLFEQLKKKESQMALPPSKSMK